MESTGASSGSTNTAVAPMPSPSFSSEDCKATNFEFDPSISEEEKRFYIKAYPTIDVVRERKTHCTVCKIHIGTAPVQETGIKMHPILRVTHCNKCHDFYNSGEFSKGEDGSELYCRWCGQGGEVYCCSSCPYVFCKSCIVKNLSRGVVADIEQNENWNCFSCAPKILWPLRAQHWALMNYIEYQKKELYSLNLSESELKGNLGKDRSRCCRLAKAKCGNMSDSMESLDSLASRRSHSSSFSAKKALKNPATSPQLAGAAKRAKSNDEVVCTPDLLSMLEPDCQITVPVKPNRPIVSPAASTPKIMSIQQPQSGFGSMSPMAKNSAPPPLVLRNTAIKLRPTGPPPVVRRTIVGPRTPNPGGNGTPVYHTINGYRIDLNSAAQQETFRLPNGKLIQVKRQGPTQPGSNTSTSHNNWQHMSNPQTQRIIPQTIASRPVQITPHPYNISVQQQPGQHPQVVRYHNNVMGTTTISPVSHNGTPIQILNGQVNSAPHQQQQQPAAVQQSATIRPVMVRHVFPDNSIGQARTGLQNQVFNAMEICIHLTNKLQTYSNSNAYKQARSFMEVKELYIHLSYMLTYAIGRFKSLQDKCLGDMRSLGFSNDADSLENGQLAADKQASDDEDNEIEIVEPKTDLINLDSDDDEPTTSTPIKLPPAVAQLKSQTSFSSPKNGTEIRIKQGTSPVPVAATTELIAPAPVAVDPVDENMDLMSMAQSFLASMLEVDIIEGPLTSPGPTDATGQKKQPRKKLTNKPNPTLLKQKALMERERLDEMKRNDQKLKMKCSVELKKAEEVFPFAKEMLEARAKEKLELEETNKNETHNEETEIKATETDEKSTTQENELNNESSEINAEEEKEKESSEKSAENILDDSTEKENSTENSATAEETNTHDDKDKEEADEQLNNSNTDESHDNKDEHDNDDAQNKDDEEKDTNDATNGADEITETMETDVNTPDTAKNEAMEVDEEETAKENNITIADTETDDIEMDKSEEKTEETDTTLPLNPEDKNKDNVDLTNTSKEELPQQPVDEGNEEKHEDTTTDSTNKSNEQQLEGDSNEEKSKDTTLTDTNNSKELHSIDDNEDNNKLSISSVVTTEHQVIIAVEKVKDINKDTTQLAQNVENVQEEDPPS